MKVCPNAIPSVLVEKDWRMPDTISSDLDFHEIQSKIFQHCKDLEAAGEPVLAETVGLLGHIAGFISKLNDPDNPFSHVLEMANGDRSTSPDDLTSEHIDVMKELLLRTKNPLMIARLNDLLWLRVRPTEVKYALSAVETYLELALHWAEDDYLIRAIQLWRMTGQKADIGKKIEEIAIKLMELDKDEPKNFVRFQFYRCLLSCFKEEDGPKWAELGIKLSEESLKQKDYRKARSYVEVAGKFYSKIKDRNGAKLMVDKEADLYIEEARTMKAAGGAPLFLQHLYNKAIEVNSNTPGRAELVKVLKAELYELQKSITMDLKHISVPVDLKEPIEEKLRAIQKATFMEALSLISHEAIPFAKEKLYRDAEEHMKSFPLQALIQTEMLDEKGKIIARKPGVGGGEDERLAAVRGQAAQYLKMAVNLKTNIIEWAQREINNRTDFDQEEIFQLLIPNPFVPRSRVFQYQTGILRGLKGDWISCLYILVPQLENSFRYVMDQRGHTMIRMESDGTQQEKDLNSFVYTDEFKSLFGEDMALHLQFILTDKIGFNLRNDLAHGLLVDGKAVSLGPYVLSLTLLLCETFQKKFH